jgi:hypothetical protein
MIAAPRLRATPVMRSSEGKMSVKLTLRRFVMAFVLGGYSVLGVGMSREKIESLMDAMNQSNMELSISQAGEDDPTEASADQGEHCP